MSKPRASIVGKDEPPLPSPAEDLSADDDLLSWILVDQLGCMPNSRLGVHPQENKFVGPQFKTEEVLNIVRETVIQGNVNAAMIKLLEFPLIKAHLESKRTESQRDRFTQHLRRYLLCYMPTSRVDIHSTDRYTHVTKHPELAVFATRPLAVGVVLSELQGSVVPLPEEWRAEMDLGDEFAREAAGQESEESDAESEVEVVDEQVVRRKGKEVERGQRRSDRTRRRDFSIVWSGLKQCYQLFLGPARFLNHDCSPTVELLRQGNYITFRVIRAIRIGDEITAYYGDNYFGKDNIECLCLTCEQSDRGHYSHKPPTSRSGSEPRSETSMTPQKPKPNRQSGLRREFVESNASEAGASETMEDGPSAPDLDVEMMEIGSGSESDPEPVVRAKLVRAAKSKAKPWSFLKYPKPAPRVDPSEVDSSIIDVTEDLPDDFPRCGSCARPLHDRMWYAGRYFDHCARCTRHAFIYGLPWPAHRQTEVQEYPPSHLIPPGYIPRKISSIPLPSLQKKKFKEVLVEVPPDDPIPISREFRRQLRVRKDIAMEDFTVQSLREAAWAVQTAQEDAILLAVAAAEARIEASRLAKEEKKRREANTLKGSGIWHRWEYVDDAELKRREEERNKPTTGTRRGRVFNLAGDGADNAPRPVSNGESSRAKPRKTNLSDKDIRHLSSSTSPVIRLRIGGKGAPASPVITHVLDDSDDDLPEYTPLFVPLKKVTRIIPQSPSSTPPPVEVSPVKARARARKSQPTPKRQSRPSVTPRHISLSATESPEDPPPRSRVKARRQPSPSPSDSPEEIASPPRKRGRPLGSGKYQKAALRRSLSSSAAGTSSSNRESSSSRLVESRVVRRNRRVPDSDDEEELEAIEAIEAEEVLMPIRTPNTAAANMLRTAHERSRERSIGSTTGTGSGSGTGSGERRKARAFFPAHLPALKFKR